MSFIFTEKLCLKFLSIRYYVFSVKRFVNCVSKWVQDERRKTQRKDSDIGSVSKKSYSKSDRDRVSNSESDSKVIARVKNEMESDSESETGLS